MNLNIDFDRAKYEGPLKAVLAAAALFLSVWIIRIWWSPLPVPEKEEGRVNAYKTYAGRVLPEPSFYNVVVEKDIFTSARARMKPKPAVKVVKPEPPSPVVETRKPPPRLSLIGTVLFDDGEAALIDYPGMGRPAYYRAGDEIEGFVITTINKDYVVLEREGEVLKVAMSASSQGQNVRQAGQPPGQGAPGRPSDIPAGLVPRK